ncbi:MAG: AmmeMemoRadiSam system protein B [Ignavibacteria bacterium]|nr:AmmeMemoRadiSam system protein B [Ignavibacteria bacterium]
MKFQHHLPAPALRRDLEIFTYTTESGEEKLYLQCSKGYGQAVNLPIYITSIIELLDGKSTIDEITNHYNLSAATSINSYSLAHFLSDLDEMCLLESETFYTAKKIIDEFRASTVREAICAGNAYPDSPEELSAFLTSIMNLSEPHQIPANGIIAPHIDLRLGGSVYAAAYQAISTSDADLFVIFATSHYANYDLIIPTNKDFQTPLGLVKTDRELLDTIRKELPFEVTMDDIAHRLEHSIELELVFLQHCFPERNFTILPLLVTSFESFISAGILPSQNEKVAQITDAIRKVVEQSGRKAVYISSGDLAHIGRKFGDSYDAENMLETLASVDSELLEQLQACNQDGFYSQIAAAQDKWKICGLPPNYMMLETMQPQEGKYLAYEQWNESERQSAVSFGAVAYY